MNRLPLSVVYVAQNAAAVLPRSLASVQGWADEIVVVDGGSSDATREIAEGFGARVIDRPWAGFAAQRQFAVEQAQQDWVLMLDSDEVLRPEGREAIQATLMAPSQAAYRLRRCSSFHGRRIRHGDWAQDTVLRLFDRRRGRYDLTETVHESWHCEGPVGDLGVMALDHYSYTDYAQLLGKMQQYAQLNAQKVYARGRPVAASAPMSHAMAAFLRTYLLRLGFLDGVDGAAIAWTTALGAFMKYAIAREMQQGQGLSDGH
ncbi:glycosyltransferase family 2 protein [Acidithiobacillus sp. IBUN Pt1247-S3]|uniref:glycosyltransferase family 2 protein n=1 Tax=Acidithiobacillus sp. IBUN Pt1247-S3 TaxID=3166642 RepID=UPI0034E3A51E